MRWMCTHSIHELAKIDERVFFIGSDFGPGVWQDIPERYLHEGISEANLTGIAAGLALTGKIPFIHTIAPFLTRRNYEQVALDLCEQNLPVRLTGSGAGLAYANLGPTHMAVDDIAIMRVLPNMTVIAPADKEEMRRVIMSTADHPGPMYIRVGKGFEPVVTDERRFEIGKAYAYREGNDALVITTGITLRLAQEAADSLIKDGIKITVLHLPTVKPLPEKTILDYASGVPIVITVEEHQITGGLGSAVAEVLAESDLCRPPRLRRIGVQDRFPSEYGTQESCMARHGITTTAIIEAVRTRGDTTRSVPGEPLDRQEASAPFYSNSTNLDTTIRK